MGRLLEEYRSFGLIYQYYLYVRKKGNSEELPFQKTLNYCSDFIYGFSEQLISELQQIRC